VRELLLQKLAGNEQAVQDRVNRPDELRAQYREGAHQRGRGSEIPLQSAQHLLMLTEIKHTITSAPRSSIGARVAFEILFECKKGRA